jgi:hypothetical protein
MTEQPEQPASELQLVHTIGVEGFRELVAWVAEGATAEERQARGEKANAAIADVLDDVDRVRINEALHFAAEGLRESDTQSRSPGSPEPLLR